MTRDDFPEAQKGVFMEVLANTEVVSENMMARDKVLYKGHALAAVAAESKHLAEEGLKLIRVDYEELSPVLDVREAMKPGASLVHEDQRMITKVEEDGSQDAPSNVAFHLQFKRGDVEQGLAEAEAVVEREFHTRPVHPGYIEPQNCTAWWGPDGKLTIWTSNQGPFVVRHQVACLLNIPASDVKVVPMEIGGGFGGKVLVYLDAAAAVLSRKTGHPVKMVMSRQEGLPGDGPGAGELYAAEDGGGQGRPDHGCRVLPGPRGWGVPGRPGGGGDELEPGALQPREHAGRRLRRRGEQAQGRGLQGAGGADRRPGGRGGDR